MSKTAAAPSLVGHELPAVTTPPSKGWLQRANVSTVVSGRGTGPAHNHLSHRVIYHYRDHFTVELFLIDGLFASSDQMTSTASSRDSKLAIRFSGESH
jgi:hypothetical protein